MVKIIDSISQGGHHQLDNREAVVEVLSEASSVDLLS
jgi:hypothetical protein